MHMTGQQRIPATRQQVWDGLYDPEVLRRSIPGCQMVEKEAEDRMRAIAEIKIGPIGARFTGTVTLSDIDPLNSYTLTIEAQGGTVGFVRNIAKVKLSEADGGTLLAYEMDAQIGGRLAQLGGPIMDATAKQLAARFFAQFGKIVSGDAEAAAAPAEAGAGPSRSVARATAHSAPASGGLPMAWILALAVSGFVGYLIGQGGSGDPAWMGLSIGLLTVIVAAAGFEFGRRAAAPVVTLDAALLAKLLEDRR
ncbi:carbon monoxide dehydrogenase [Solimonas fluminis]|uniref:Carbon monoxide dehydrogenase n=2 Tax=Solimonas fluminis TaxID=2086571 RepID=A0A2S5THD9_9GAMM|nr:carbon monoxide dehydrogenase [Solimonas fluminis]